MPPLDEGNYSYSYLAFQDRQAGVNLVYDPDEERFYYHAYCLEITLLKDLLSVEFEFLEDAIKLINEEFAQWEVKTFEAKKSGCATCVAK